MFELGYEIIDFPHSTTEVFSDCQKYFAQEAEIKKCDIKLSREHGYHVNDRRECYVVRDGQNPTVIASAYPLFEQIHQLGVEILERVERDLQLAPTTLTSMVQRAVKPDLTNVSLLRLFQYSTTPMEDNLSALAHEDIGMISIIPCSTDPGIEVFDNWRLQWIQVERLLEPNQALVLVGETLAKSSLGEYTAALHQVARTDTPRCSLVYHMRANPEAVLNSRSLETVRTGPFVPPFRKMVKDFLEFEEKRRKSINGAF